MIKIKSPLKELNITNYSSFIGTINRYYKDYSCYGVKIISSFGKIYKGISIPFYDILEMKEILLNTNK